MRQSVDCDHEREAQVEKIPLIFFDLRFALVVMLRARVSRTSQSASLIHLFYRLRIVYYGPLSLFNLIGHIHTFVFPGLE